MAFDYLTQPQGPVVPISLFGDAYSAGINAGNAQKTTGQAIAQGIQGGIQNYLSTTEGFQQNAIRQNQIEQLPVTNAIKAEELTSDQQTNQLQALQLDTAQKEHQLQLDNIEATLKAKNAEATQALDKINTQKSIADDIESNDPAKWHNPITDSKKYSAMLDDPQLMQNYYQSMIQKNAFGPGEQEAFRKAMDNATQRKIDMQTNAAIRELEVKHKASATDDILKANDALEKEGTVGDLIKNRSLEERAGLWTAPFGQKQIVNGKIAKGEDNPVIGIPDTWNVFDARNNYVGDVKAPGYKVINGLATQWNKVFGTGKQNITQQTPQQGTGTPGVSSFGGDAPQNRVKEKPTIDDSNLSGVVKQKLQELSSNTDKPKGTTIDSSTAAAMEDKRMREMFDVPTNSGASGTSGVPTAKGASYVTPEGDKIIQEINPNGIHIKNEVPTTSATNIVYENLANKGPTPVSKDVLNTEVVYTPPKQVWQNINTNPLVSGESALIKGLATIESGGKTDAVSPTGVRGVLQVTKAVANQYGLDRNIPSQNLLAGKKYLSDLLIQFNGNLRLALSAYNAGPGAILDAVKEAESTDWSAVRDVLKQNLSKEKFKEVENYADKIISAAVHYMNPISSADNSYLQLLMENGLLKV